MAALLDPRSLPPAPSPGRLRLPTELPRATMHTSRRSRSSVELPGVTTASVVVSPACGVPARFASAVCGHSNDPHDSQWLRVSSPAREGRTEMRCHV